jgi:AbrB family looped-hinge helix DNA binding protein
MSATTVSAPAAGTTMTTKGQVTIPKPVRDRLGVAPGQAVMFDVAPDGRVVVTKASGAAPISRFETLRGCAGPGAGTAEIMALLRGPALQE